MAEPNGEFESLIVEEVPCPVVAVDQDLRIVTANAAFRRVFDKGPGSHCYSACMGRDEPCHDCVALQVFGDGKAHGSTFRGSSASGRPLLYDVRALPAPGKGSQVTQVALVMGETSRIEELEQKLQLAERLATVGLTASGLAHTTKNILGGLEGAIFTLDTGLERQDLQLVSMAWEMVKRYLDQVSSLVANLLDYARDQAPRREIFEPGELVNRVVDLFEDKGSLVGVCVQGQIEDGLPPVHVDPEAIHACLANLVTNAMDACQWDPEVNKEHRIQIQVRQHRGGGVEFEVDDNGSGISPENQSKILSSSFSTKGLRGTGLGLLLTRKAVEQHGGTIRFDSTPGQGTKFLFVLPAEIRSG